MNHWGPSYLLIRRNRGNVELIGMSARPIATQRVRLEAARPGFDLVEARDGDRLVGFAYGNTMAAGDWWGRAEESAPDGVGQRRRSLSRSGRCTRRLGRRDRAASHGRTAGGPSRADGDTDSQPRWRRIGRTRPGPAAGHGYPGLPDRTGCRGDVATNPRRARRNSRTHRSSPGLAWDWRDLLVVRRGIGEVW